MRTLIQNRDLKTLFTGVAGAAVAGLLMGAAMYPDLDADEVQGPQILMNGGGPRSYAEASSVGLAAYHGRVPDYVVGTDWTKPRAPHLEVLAYEDRAEPAPADVMAYEAPAVVQTARWEDEPREPPRYPSEYGNVHTGADLPAPPEPPAPEDEAPS